jgi:hypothetical protein
MKRVTHFAVALAALTAVTGMMALPFAAQAADEFGIAHEKASRMEAKVVSLNCEVTGNYPANCGGGRHQLGLLRDDGRLIAVIKNFDSFASAVEDLLPFCGRRVIADGLLIENPKMPMFMLQFKKAAENGEWSRATAFSQKWSAENGGQKGADWYAKDARVKAELKATGVLGIPGLKPPKE